MTSNPSPVSLCRSGRLAPELLLRLGVYLIEPLQHTIYFKNNSTAVPLVQKMTPDALAKCAGCHAAWQIKAGN